MLDCSPMYLTPLNNTTIIRRIMAKEIMIKVLYWVEVDEKEIKTKLVLLGKNAEVQFKNHLMVALATATSI